MSNINSIDDLHNKVKKIFNNPNINFFIIMCLILLISCYAIINTNLRFAISSFVANPVIILTSLIIIIVLGFYNINIAILVLLLLFIILFGASLFNNKYNNNYNHANNLLETFKGSINDNDSESDSDDDDDNDNDNNDNDELDNKLDNKLKKDNNNDKPKPKSKLEIMEEEQTETDNKISNIKNIILGTVNSFKNTTDNEYNKGLIENKNIILKNAQQMNNNNKSNNKNSKSKSNFKNTNSSSKSKENFKTVDKRKFDPSKEEDTNLLITKEILTDMINRIEYNYESNKYLKKYIKHRIEEIVDMNKLLEEDDS